VVDVVAAGAKRQALFGYAGLSVTDLSATLAKAFGKTAALAETLADTAQVAFFRTATDRAFKAVEADLPQMVIRYEYEGPLDRITRKFCAHLILVAKTYTRAEIDAMNAGAGQPGPVWIYCGGMNCRHQWMISIPEK
jgi:hypothetical protein